MVKNFDRQYNCLGLSVPSADMDPREKAEIIFHAACKKQGYDPAQLPLVHNLPEKFQVFPVAAYKLEVIVEALNEKQTANWNSRSQDKWGSWFYMNNPGFRVDDSGCDRTYSYTTGGARLCTFQEETQDFFAIECIALWADFNGGQLPA